MKPVMKLRSCNVFLMKNMRFLLIFQKLRRTLLSDSSNKIPKTVLDAEEWACKMASMRSKSIHFLTESNGTRSSRKQVQFLTNPKSPTMPMFHKSMKNSWWWKTPANRVSHNRFPMIAPRNLPLNFSTGTNLRLKTSPSSINERSIKSYKGKINRKCWLLGAKTSNFAVSTSLANHQLLSFGKRGLAWT